MNVTRCPPRPAAGIADLNDGYTARHRGSIQGTPESLEPVPGPPTTGSGYDAEEALRRVFGGREGRP